jgi:7-carboxy-7-deazaguanine synthase
MNIILTEPIHPIIQGEGKFVGKRMLVIRVCGCDLKCFNCDSKYTWMKNNNQIRFGIEKFIIYLGEKNNKYDFKDILITGGSPNLYQDAIDIITDTFCYLDFHIEDAGDKKWKDSILKRRNVFFTFSPKIGYLQSSIEIKNWKGLRYLPENYIIKIVINKKQKHFKFLYEFINSYKIPKKNIYLMPYGITGEEIIEQSKFLIPFCFENGFNYSPRLHILLFNNERMK